MELIEQDNDKKRKRDERETENGRNGNKETRERKERKEWFIENIELKKCSDKQKERNGSLKI